VAHLRTALVTGGSGGIGYQLCRHLAAHDTRVFVHAPTPPEAHDAVARLIRDGADRTRLHAVAADYRRLHDVVSLAGYLDREYGRIDLLVNNAGALGAATRTGDGFDTTLQINYLAPYVLTRRLGRALNTAAARIVNVCSALHREAHLDADHPEGTPGTRPAAAFANAQLALVMFTRALTLSAEQRVTAVAVHPGTVDTGTLDTGSVDTGTVAAVHGLGGLPVADGAEPVIRAADCAAAEVVNGGYYEGLLPAEAAPAGRDDEAALRLWRATARLLGWDYTAGRDSQVARAA
jgi:NAD(P)-dependent dehydrogenase (short-subunit alcohol dehydrogenase family)